MRNAIHVRAAVPDDVEVIASMNGRMAVETEGRPLDAGRLRSGVQAVFQDAGKGCYFVAESQSKPAGCLLVTREWSDWRNGWFWWIQSVFVEPDCRGAGVFRALYERVQADAREDPGVCGLRLYVDDDNRSAQSVYERLGMTQTQYKLYEVDFVLDTVG